MTLYNDIFRAGAITVPEHLVMRRVPIAVLAMCRTAGPHVTCPILCITRHAMFSLCGALKFLCAVCWSGLPPPPPVPKCARIFDIFFFPPERISVILAVSPDMGKRGVWAESSFVATSHAIASLPE